MEIRSWRYFGIRIKDAKKKKNYNNNSAWIHAVGNIKRK